MSIQAVLFDLDGTLLDTAPDMLNALNRLRTELDLPNTTLGKIRAAVSHGSEAILQAGFSDIFTARSPSEKKNPFFYPPHFPDKTELRERFLNYYQEDIASATHFFQGMERVVTTLEDLKIPWGIVTNKPSYLTFSILDQLDLSSRCGVVVSGDTTPVSKPDPLPLQHACGVLQVEGADVLYVGDAERDIQAGRAAEMSTLVALYGYLSKQDRPEEWGADGMIETPEAILEWLGLKPSLAE